MAQLMIIGVEICLESVSWQRSDDSDVMDRAIPSRERVFPNTWNGLSATWSGRSLSLPKSEKYGKFHQTLSYIYFYPIL